MERRTYTNLDEIDYWTIKELLHKGYSSRKIRDMTKRSTSTISYVRRTQNFRDYKIKLYREAHNGKNPPKGFFKPNIKPNGTKQASTTTEGSKRAENGYKCVISVVLIVCLTVLLETLLILAWK